MTIREKTQIIINVTKELSEDMMLEDFITSAVYTLFIESVMLSNSKTELKSIFVKYVNEELDRKYLRNDAIYCTIKVLIQ